MRQWPARVDGQGKAGRPQRCRVPSLSAVSRKLPSAVKAANTTGDVAPVVRKLEAQIDRADAKYLLQEILDVSAAWLLAHDNEALSADPQATLANVLAALGLDPKIAKTVEPRTAKLADSESHMWAARFRQENRV